MSKSSIKKYFLIGKKKLFNINRSLTGQGNLRTLNLIKKEFSGFKIKNFKSNSNAFDWKIPSEWNVKNAYVVDKYNKKIIDFKKNFLHLVGYSHPMKTNIKKNELLNILYTEKKLKNAIPYVTSYYTKKSAFCVSENFKKKIKKKYDYDDIFKIVIDSSFKKNGKMHYGEVVLKGESKQEILISTYICHPNMANNELSGIILTMSLINHFQKKKKLKKTIRFIFVPETIGTIAYLNKNLDYLKKNVVAGYVLSCVGDEKNYSFKPTRLDNSITDIALHETFKKLKIKPKKFPFLDAGSDERRFNYPGIDIPIGLISRTKFDEYKEYHTSLDDFSLITVEGIYGSFKLTTSVIENIMNKILPKSTTLCEPHLSKRKIYNPKMHTKIVNFLAFCDGKHDLKIIGKKNRFNKKELNKYYKFAKIKNLITI